MRDTSGYKTFDLRLYSRDDKSDVIVYTYSYLDTAKRALSKIINSNPQSCFKQVQLQKPGATPYIKRYDNNGYHHEIVRTVYCNDFEKYYIVENHYHP